MLNDTNRLIRAWIESPIDRYPSDYYQLGNTLVMNAGGNSKTVAVRFLDDCGEPFIIAREDVPLSLFDGLGKLVAINLTTATKIFKFFELEFSVLRGKEAVGSDAIVIRNAVKTFEELGLPMPDRLKEVSRITTSDSAVLLAFKDTLNLPRRFRYAVQNSGLRLPKPLGSYLERLGYVIFEDENDAVQVKMQSEEDVTIIDLWPDVVVEGPPSAPNAE